MLKDYFVNQIVELVLCQAFYYVNDNKEVDLITLQIVHYIICHNNPILNLNSKNQARGRLIIYNTTNSITTLKKNCKCKPFYYFLNFEKEMNNMLNEEEK